jgi:hypothetical protein
MRKVVSYVALALIATLAACSHGSNSALPGQQSGNSTDAMHAKMLREAQRVPSTFVAPKHPGFMAEIPDVHTWATGIQQAGEAPVPGGMFEITNQYNTTVAGQHVTVYAGSLKTTGSGILLVVRRSADLHTASAQTFTVAPSAVRIVSATADGQLQLQTTGSTHQSVPFRIAL